MKGGGPGGDRGASGKPAFAEGPIAGPLMWAPRRAWGLARRGGGGGRRGFVGAAEGAKTGYSGAKPREAFCWAEALIKIARMTLTIKLDGNWSSFQLANSAPPLSVTGSAIAPSARMARLVVYALHGEVPSQGSFLAGPVAFFSTRGLCV